MSCTVERGIVNFAMCTRCEDAKMSWDSDAGPGQIQELEKDIPRAMTVWESMRAAVGGGVLDFNDFFTAFMNGNHDAVAGTASEEINAPTTNVNSSHAAHHEMAMPSISACRNDPYAKLITLVFKELPCACNRGVPGSEGKLENDLPEDEDTVKNELLDNDDEPASELCGAEVVPSWDADARLTAKVEPYSVDKKFPQGPMFQHMATIRNTICQRYAKRFAEFNWFATFRSATVAALTVRLDRYDDKIMGKVHLDIQNGYKQLKSRITSIQKVYKAIHSWVDEKNDACLAKAVQPFDEILHFFEYIQDCNVAADIALIIYMGIFTKEVQEKGFASAVADVDFQDIHNLASALHTFQPVDPTTCVSQKSVVKKDEGVQDSIDLCQGKRTKKRRGVQAKGTLDVSAHINFADTSAGFAARMMVWQLQALFASMPMDLHENAESLGSLIKDVSSAETFWGKVEERVEDTAAKEEVALYKSIFAALVHLMRSCGPITPKPAAAIVREARRLILEKAASKNVHASELCKAMIGYNGTKAVIASAKDFAQSGLADDTATSSARRAMQQFMAAMTLDGESSPNWAAWVESNGGRPGVTPSDFIEKLGAIRALCTGTISAIQRWSMYAAQEQAGETCTSMQQALEVVEVGGVLMLRCFVTAFIDPISNYVDAYAEELGLLAPEAASEGSDVMVAAGLSDGAVATPPSKEECTTKLNATLAAEAIQNFSVSAQDLEDHLKCSLDMLSRVVVKLQEKIGVEQISARFEGKRPPLVLKRLIMENAAVMKNIITFFSAFRDLKACADNPLFPAKGEAPETAMAARLVIFARKRDTICKDPLALQVFSPFVDVDQLTEITLVFNDFREAHCDPIFEQIMVKAVDDAQHIVGSASLMIQGVNKTVLATKPFSGLYQLVITKPSSMEMRKEAGVDTSYASAKDAAASESVDSTTKGPRMLMPTILQSLPHNTAIAFLEELLAASGLSSFRLRPSVAEAGAQPNEIPTKTAIFLMKVAAGAKDIVTLAAEFDQELLKSGDKDYVRGLSRVVGYIAELLHALLSAIGSMESMLSSQEALDVETGGFNPFMPLPNLRLWRESMAFYASRCKDLFLRELGRCVQAKTDKLKALTANSWEFCFPTPDVLDIELACTSLKPKLKQIADAHFHVYSSTTSLSQVCAMLEITPRAQDHPILKPVVADALAGLARATQTCTFINGVTLLKMFADDAGGPNQANAFLKANTREKNPNIPKEFWTCLERLSEGLPTVVQHQQVDAVSKRHASSNSDTSPAKKIKAESANDCASTSASETSGTTLALLPGVKAELGAPQRQQQASLLRVSSRRRRGGQTSLALKQEQA